MNWRNQTTVMEFVLIGFSTMPNVELLLFPLVLMMYIVTVTGNILITVIVLIDPARQLPMYFFLMHLSFLEICFTLVTIPKMLVNLLLKQAVWIFNFPFCESKEVNHFFCDVLPVLKIICADTSLFEMQSIVCTLLFLMFPFVFILISYIRIITTILRISSAEGRHKAFSTCSSHLIVVTLFYGSASIVYLRPNSNYSPEEEKMMSLFYAVLTPMLNPIIYTLRNHEVKEAMKRILGQKIFS